MMLLNWSMLTSPRRLFGKECVSHIFELIYIPLNTIFTSAHSKIFGSNITYYIQRSKKKLKTDHKNG
jgi:hypothetical protein